MTVTEKKLAANRANALRATGPKTARGKKWSSKNSFKHGIYSPTLRFDDDSEAAEYESMRGVLLMDPVSSLQQVLLDRIGCLLWKLRKVEGMQNRELSNFVQGTDTARLAEAMGQLTLMEEKLPILGEMAIDGGSSSPFDFCELYLKVVKSQSAHSGSEKVSDRAQDGTQLELRIGPRMDKIARLHADIVRDLERTIGLYLELRNAK